MTNILLHIGRDADDINFHSSAVEPSSGELLFFQMLAHPEGLAWVARQIKADLVLDELLHAFFKSRHIAQVV